MGDRVNQDISNRRLRLVCGISLAIILFNLGIGNILAHNVVFSRLPSSSISALASPAPTSEWDQYHGDASHNGLSSYPGPSKNVPAWTTQIGGGSDGLIVSGHTLIASSFHANIFDSVPSVYALSESNGTILFDYSTPQVCGPINCFTGVSGTVYPASGGGLVFFEDYAEDHVGDYFVQIQADYSANGQTAWRTDVPSNCCFSTAYGYGMVAYSGGHLIYSGYNSHKVWEYLASAGTYIWNTTISGPINTIPTVGNGEVILPNGQNVTAISLSGGSLLWNFTAGASIVAPPSYAEGSFFLGTLGGDVFRISGTGVQSWKTNLGTAIETTPSVANGLVYLGADDGSVYAINETTGIQKWKYNTGGSITASPAISSNGLVYEANTIGTVYALNATGLDLVWRYDTGNSISSGLILDGGSLFSVNSAGKIFAFSSADFNLITAPATVDKLVNDTATSTINLTPVNSFSAGVTLTVTTNSTKLLCNLSSNSLKGGSETSTLSCKASSSGNYSAMVTGTSGLLSHSAVVTYRAEDFMIAPSSRSLAVDSSTAGISTISISPLNGFTSTVIISFDTDSSNLSCVLSSTSIATGSGTSNLSCTGSHAGNYTVTVAATSGTISRFTRITYQVEDFMIGASPAEVTAKEDVAGTSTINVSPVNGFAGTVALSIHSSPSGLSCEVSQTTITASGTSIISCLGSPGLYTITVTGTSGTRTQSTSFQLTLIARSSNQPLILGVDPGIFYLILGVLIIMVILVALIQVRRSRNPTKKGEV